MNAEELRARTKNLAVRIVEMVERLPRTIGSDVMGKQLIRSATSVAANYRAVGRARSRADFINKLGIVVEEADETLFWLEMLIDLKKVKEADVKDIVGETKEIVAIFTAAHKTARTNRK
ncbi:MAG: four helix bundle protein [Ignavibacteriales bacterium]|nr:four helix bundle protein [Ignavibacteriales bacterium]